MIVPISSYCIICMYMLYYNYFDHQYAPFKPGHKGTYAERARALGLEPFARAVMDGKEAPDLKSAVNVKEKGKRQSFIAMNKQKGDLRLLWDAEVSELGFLHGHLLMPVCLNFLGEADISTSVPLYIMA